MTKYKYKVGDWFAVPLTGGGFGLGLVARANPGGVVLGYFFGPRRESTPSLAECCNLRENTATMVQMFGDLGLRQGRWPILGRCDSWDPSQWPMPIFIRYEELTGRSFRVIYDDNDPNRVLREEQVTPGVSEQGPSDDMFGAKAIELTLSARLT
jgi:hypothetical protein